jgi:hypothetical protein
VLVHPHDRGIDHLHGRIVIGSQCIHDPVPDAGPPLTDKPIIASGAGTIGHRQVASGSACAQDLGPPLSASISSLSLVYLKCSSWLTPTIRA